MLHSKLSLLGNSLNLLTDFSRTNKERVCIFSTTLRMRLRNPWGSSEGTNCSLRNPSSSLGSSLEFPHCVPEGTPRELKGTRGNSRELWGNPTEIWGHSKELEETGWVPSEFPQSSLEFSKFPWVPPTSPEFPQVPSELPWGSSEETLFFKNLKFASAVVCLFQRLESIWK